MKKKKKILLIMLAVLSVFVVALSGCTIVVKQKENPTEKPTPPTLEEKTTTEKEIETTPFVQSPSNNWEDMTLSIDGINYAVPFSYLALGQDGWSFNLSDYGYANGYILNEGDKSTSTIYLENAKYNDGFDFSVGFVNASNVKRDILECEIWALDMNMEYAHGKYPDVKLAQGLTWGDSMEAAKAYYGEPDDTYHFEEDGRVADTLTYGSSWSGSGGVMKLTFTNNALTAFSLKQY